MDKAQRAELLRHRFKAKWGVLFIARGAKKPVQRSSTFSRAYPFGVSLCETRCEWVTLPDASRDDLLPAKKRQSGALALTRIAERWDERKKFAAPRNRG